MENLETIDNNREIEVVNLFPANPAELLKLVTLSSYDRMTNDNTLTPIAPPANVCLQFPIMKNSMTRPRV